MNVQEQIKMTKQDKQTNIRQMIIGEQERNRRKLFEHCLQRRFHRPYPDGYFERCFTCGFPLTLTMLKEDVLNELKYEFLDLMSAYGRY